MIVPDINLLLYAVVDSFPLHARARIWWEQSLSGRSDVALVPPVIFGFVRLATNPRVFDVPLSVDRATGYVDEWRARTRVRVLAPSVRHLDIAFGLLRSVGAAGNLTTDAQIAAYAIEHQAEVCSADTDFARFPGLRWKNPLA